MVYKGSYHDVSYNVGLFFQLEDILTEYMSFVSILEPIFLTALKIMHFFFATANVLYV